MDFTKPKTLLLSPLMALAASFAVLLIAFLFLSGSGSIGTYGINKTIGWGYQFSDMATVAAVLSIIIFVLGYVILWIVRMHLNRIVSIVGLCLLLMLPVIWTIEHINFKSTFTFLTASGVIVTFIVNTVFAIRYKLRDKQVS